MKTAPPAAASVTVTVPACARAIARTIDSPSPKPSSSSGTALRPKRSKICWRSPVGTPGPESLTQRLAVPASYEEPRAITSPARVCLTALSQSWSRAWVRRCSSTSAVTLAVASSVQRRSPSPRAFASTSTVRPVRSTGRRVMKSGRSLLASRIRSPTSRDIRSTSSSSSSRVSAISSGLPTSSSSRWPRSTVSGRLQLVPGVVEELPLADERRLQAVQHPVDGAGERGDVVVAGHREPTGQVGVGDLVGRLPQRAQRREQPAGLPGGEAHDEQQREARHDAVGPHRVVEPGVRPVLEGHHDQGAPVGALLDTLDVDQQRPEPAVEGRAAVGLDERSRRRRRSRGSSSPRPRPGAGSAGSSSHQPTSSSFSDGTLRRM